MKILFIRPPRYRWPFHSENSSFWQPLNFASLAAAVRDKIDGISLKIIDCPPLKIGWKSLERILSSEKPDVLCIGEETVSSREALRLAHMAREMHPHCTIVAGGVYFSNMVEDTLNNHPVDFIVIGEGETTFTELVKTLKSGKGDFGKIRGMAYKKDRKIVRTGNRSLLDMRTLPMPAYDLLPMEEYGKYSRTHKRFVAVEHSRGCVSKCNFCILWKQMGRDSGGRLYPHYRTKTVKQSLAEVTHLYEKYKRKNFCWVDPTWNVDAKWNREFADAIIKSGMDIEQSVWARADCIVRDDKNGVLARQVKAGLSQVMIGVERTDDAELKYLEKCNSSFDTTRSAFGALRKYPQILSIATYIYGIPTETAETMRRFYDLLDKIPFDMGIPIPMTPNPGSEFFKRAENQKLIEIKDFSYYNFVNPIMRSKTMSRTALLFNMLKNEVRIRTRKEQFAKKNIVAERRSGAVGRLAAAKTSMTAKFLYGMASDVLFGRPVNYNIRPGWYEG